MTIYVFRNTFMCPAHLTWVDVGGCTPLHPADIKKRTIFLVENNVDFATVSEVALTTVQELVRHKKLSPMDVNIIYVASDGTETRQPLDVEGEFIMPWPEESEASIFEINFCSRYSK